MKTKRCIHKWDTRFVRNKNGHGCKTHARCINCGTKRIWTFPSFGRGEI